MNLKLDTFLVIILIFVSLGKCFVLEIEQVDTQGYCGLIFKLVMLLQWPILSKAVIYFLTGNFCLTRRLVFHLVEL